MKTLGARRDPASGRYLGPDEKTVRRVCAMVDGDAVDGALGRWVTRRTALVMTLAEIPQCRSAKFPAAEAMVMLGR